MDQVFNNNPSRAALDSQSIDVSDFFDFGAGDVWQSPTECDIDSLDDMPSMVVNLEELEAFIGRIRTTQHCLFSVMQNGQDGSWQVVGVGGGEYMLGLNHFGLIGLFDACRPVVRHPYINLYVSHFGDLDLMTLGRSVFSSYNDAVCWAQELNRRICCLRCDLTSRAVSARLDNIRRAQRYNEESVKDYIDDLFNRYSRLMVVRLDVGYAQGLSLNPDLAARNLMVSNRYEAGCTNMPVLYRCTTPPVVPNMLIRHKDLLFDFIRQTYGDKLCGYIWKLEYAHLKGYHFHLVLFFNGAKLRQDVMIAKAIGDKWRFDISGRRGVYFNCNARPHLYKYPCIGNIDWDSPVRELGLKYMLAYLLKTDNYIRLSWPSGWRTLGKGRSPAPRNASRGGRPRKVP